jgi:hypothetical protein
MNFKTALGDLSFDCNRELRDFLAKLPEERVVIDGDNFLQFTQPSIKGRRPSEGHRFYLPISERGAVRPWFQCGPEMMEFYRHFDGLREQTPGTSGSFIPVAEVPGLEEYLGARLPDFEDILDAPVIFRAATGDWIFWSQNDGFLWYQLETGIPILAAESFSDLVRSWIKHHAVGDGAPFDSFGRE